MGKNVIISTLPNISQNYLPKVNTSNIFANSLVYDDGSSVLINTTTASAFKLDVNGTARTGALTLTGALSGTSATFSSTLTATGGVYVGSGTAGRNAFSQSDFRIAAPNDTNILNGIAANTSMTIKSDYYGGGSATPLILQSGANNNQLYLTTSGNVSIGNTNNTYKLDVSGTGNFTGALSGTTATFSGQVTATATANTYAGGALILKALGGTNPIYLTSVSGYFALSNGGGADHLLISSTGAATFSGTVTSTNNTANVVLTSFLTTFGGNNYYAGAINLYDSSNRNLLLKSPDGIANARIGTTTGQDLEIITSNTIRLTISSTGAATFSSSVTTNSGIIGNNSNHLYLSSNSAAGEISFWNNQLTTRLMTLTGGGNLGIGTTSISSVTNQTVLEVAAPQYGTVRVSANSSTVKGYFIANNQASLVSIGAETNHPLLFLTNDTERMRITSGTTNSQITFTNSTAYSTSNTFALTYRSSTLSYGVQPIADIVFDTVGDAASQIRFVTRKDAPDYATRMTITSAGNIRTYVTPSVDTHLEWYNTTGNTFVGDIWCDGNPRLNIRCISGGVYLSSGATSWTAASDETLKDINFIIEGAIDKINTLRAVSFSWKSDESKKENLGLIAQDIEKVFPQVIDENKDGIKGVRYTEMIPVLVKAIQELKVENDQQKADIESLKALINK